MSDRKPAPYPADTRAKGWRFELDMERARQSDTWTLASPEARPWLLMMWATAWEQTPCGSLPNDDELIAARIGMPPKTFAKFKTILLRKWWLAEDSRLYHDVLVQRVIEMMHKRRKESDRKALARGKTPTDVRGCPTVVPRDKDGTDMGFHPPSDTSTSTRSKPGLVDGQERDPPELPDLEGFTPTPAGAACKAMRLAGIIGTNPSHPDLLRLLAAGVTAQELGDTAAVAVSKNKSSFAYVLATVENRRIEAAAKAAVPAAAAGPGPTVASDAAERTAELLRQQANRGHSKPPADLRARVLGAAQEAA